MDDQKIPESMIMGDIPSNNTHQKSFAQQLEFSISPNSVIGRYTIIQKVGEGGMGQVYKAQDNILQRTVALKFLITGQQAEEKEIKRLLREAEAAAKLQHPNIVSLYNHSSIFL
ncbi:protein kinase [Candidatus Uabimicrobium sp. HlEnr_7]|uniref:protein kinase domain-containing protein n=1 Tax=Candidatus Uabimicrobium helgolandensis TaxID=3095367 RepID=UPI003557C5FE